MEQKITANMGIKQANRTNIYNLLHGEGALSKQAIVGRRRRDWWKRSAF